MDRNGPWRGASCRLFRGMKSCTMAKFFYMYGQISFVGPAIMIANRHGRHWRYMGSSQAVPILYITPCLNTARTPLNSPRKLPIRPVQSLSCHKIAKCFPDHVFTGVWERNFPDSGSHKGEKPVGLYFVDTVLVDGKYTLDLIVKKRKSTIIW